MKFKIGDLLIRIDDTSGYIKTGYVKNITILDISFTDKRYLCLYPDEFSETEWVEDYIVEENFRLNIKQMRKLKLEKIIYEPEIIK